MGLFDRFKSKPEVTEKPLENSAAADDYKQAIEHHNQEDFQEALRSLSHGFRKDLDFIPLYELAVQCLEKLGGQLEADLFRAVVKNGTREQESFRNLGAFFFEQGHYDLAEPFLRRAIALRPSDSDLVHDLALVLARRFRIDEAISVFEENNALDGFWNYWFWCKLRVLAGKPEGVQEGLEQLSEVLDGEADKSRIAIPRGKVEELKELLNRYNCLEQPRKDIQDWHFIQYGGVILDFFDQSEDYVAGGRYVASWGSNQAVKEVISKLKAHLRNTGYEVGRVVALPDRNAQILGRTIARQFGTSCETYAPGMDTRGALVVAGHSEDFDGLSELSRVDDRQLLFALNHNWLRNAHITPDIVGFMNQSYSFPWEGGGIRVVNMETRETERTLPDERDEDAIVEEILNEQPGPDYREDRLDFYIRHKDWLKGTGSKVNKDRFNFMMESPVPGAFFA